MDIGQSAKVRQEIVSDLAFRNDAERIALIWKEEAIVIFTSETSPQCLQNPIIFLSRCSSFANNTSWFCSLDW